MATITERKSPEGKKSYRVRIRLKGCPIQTATFSRKTDAKKWAQDTESAIREGRHFKIREAKKHTLAELINRYIEHILKPWKLSRQERFTHLEWWKKSLGCYLLSDVTPALIAETRDILAKGTTYRGTQRSSATVVRYLASLSHAFTIAVKEWGWVENNPVFKVTKPKEPRGRVRFLSDNERDRLLDACFESTNSYLYPIVVLALSTGMRQGEILRITWEDIDLKKEKITLMITKNGEIRVLPLKGRALHLVKNLEKNRRIDTNFLFPSANADKPINIRSVWERAIREAEIEDFKFHDLRHTAASFLAMNGATPSEIAAVLGHKSLQMVKRYAHISEVHTADVIEKMNEKFL